MATKEPKNISKMSVTELRQAVAEAKMCIADLMESHKQVMKGVAHVADVDYELLNRCRLQGDSYLQRHTL